MHQTSIDLPVAKREPVIKNLNQHLATLIDLKLQAKQAHWNVKGPHFIALHELFDKVASDVDEYVDEVAERVVALGGTAEGTLNQTEKASQLPEYPTDISDGSIHVKELAASRGAATKSARFGIEFSTEHGDAVTADMYTEVARGLDKWLWMLEAHLQATR